MRRHTIVDRYWWRYWATECAKAFVVCGVALIAAVALVRALELLLAYSAAWP